MFAKFLRTGSNSYFFLCRYVSFLFLWRIFLFLTFLHFVNAVPSCNFVGVYPAWVLWGSWHCFREIQFIQITPFTPFTLVSGYSHDTFGFTQLMFSHTLWIFCPKCLAFISSIYFWILLDSIALLEMHTHSGMLAALLLRAHAFWHAGSLIPRSTCITPWALP